MPGSSQLTASPGAATPMPCPLIRRLHRLRLAAPFVAAVLAGCATSSARQIPHDEFDSTTKYSRSFDATDAQTCEAARRALLSQGYVIGTAKSDLVNGRKSFQPEGDVHMELDFRIVCAPEGRGGLRTVAFVTALQDRYALKKSNNSASVGVGALGSLSLPLPSSDDSLVKVASETVTNGPFYERFFMLLMRYLATATADALPDAIEPQPGIAPGFTPGLAPNKP